MQLTCIPRAANPSSPFISATRKLESERERLRMGAASDRRAGKLKPECQIHNAFGPNLFSLIFSSAGKTSSRVCCLFVLAELDLPF